MAVPSILVRPASSVDIPAILRILAEAFGPYRDPYPATAWADTILDEDRLRQRFAEKHVFVSIEGGQVTGTLAWSLREPGVGHLRGMAVAADRLGTRTAAALLAFVEDQVRAAGCTALTLHSPVHLVRAHAFYRRHGYVESEPRFLWDGMPVLGMRKSLG